jgi:hypothetical protein
MQLKHTLQRIARTFKPPGNRPPADENPDAIEQRGDPQSRSPMYSDHRSA